MRTLLVLAAWAACAAANAPPPGYTCTASNVAGYTCQAEVRGEGAGDVGVLHWVVTSDLKNMRLRFEVEGAGFVAVGFGQQMIGAEAVIAQASEGNVAPGLYDLSGRTRGQLNLRTVGADHLWLLGTATGSVGSRMYVEVTRTVDGGRPGNELDLNNARLIYSWSPTATSVQYHGARKNRVGVNIFSGATTYYTGSPTLPPRPPPTGIPPTATPPVVPVPQRPQTMVPWQYTTAAPARTCTPSNLRRIGTVSYECMLRVDTWVTVHWTNTPGTRFMAVEWASGGWGAVSWPSRANNMVPAEGLLVTADGTVTRVRIQSRSVNGIVPDASLLPMISDTNVERNNGRVTVRFLQNVPLTSGARGAEELQAASQGTAINFAMHLTDGRLRQKHTSRTSAVINFEQADLLSVGRREASRGIRAHGIFFAIWVAVIMPFAMIFKRFGASFGYANAAYIVHAGIMGVTLLVVAIWVPLALSRYDTHKDSHRRLGICLLTFTALQALLGMCKRCFVSAEDQKNPKSTSRFWFTVIHGTFGLCIWIMFVSQAFVGCHIYRKNGYTGDLPRDLEIMMKIFVVFWGVVFFVMSCLDGKQKARKRGERESQGRQQQQQQQQQQQHAPAHHQAYPPEKGYEAQGQRAHENTEMQPAPSDDHRGGRDYNSASPPPQDVRYSASPDGRGHAAASAGGPRSDEGSVEGSHVHASAGASLPRR